MAVAKNINELHSLMKDLPDYADQFLNMICKVLQEYRETCHGSYKGERKSVPCMTHILLN